MRRTLFLCTCAILLLGCFGDDDDAMDGGGKTPADANGDATTNAMDAGANDEDAGGGPPAVEDPLPNADTPGEYTCDGCPSSADFSDFMPNFGPVTSRGFSGTVTGAQGDGTFYVTDGEGASFSGPIPTDPNTGTYTVTVPLLCGEQTIKLVWRNANGAYGAVLAATTTDCVDADIRLTLSWDALGRDFELHLVREGGTINDRTGDRYVSNDCTWNTCIGGNADWGVEGDASDNPTKDVDNTGNHGPENIFYAKPEPGRYTVMVEHWGSGDPNASGAVIINVRGARTVVVPIEKLAPQWVFTAATIDWPSAKITPVAEQYDCTGSWSGGCTAEIP